MNKLRSYEYIWEEGALIQNSNEICGVLERMTGGWHCVLGMLASLAPPFETSGQVLPGESSYKVCIFAIRAK